MNYRICTVANDNYREFLFYFTKSALEKCKNMQSIHILYTGENIPNDDVFLSNKVDIIKHSELVKTKEIWDNGWQKNVDLKSTFLKSLAIKFDDPIFLIDADCYILNEFIDIIDITKDLVVTKRHGYTPYIASFVGLINPKRTLDFIDLWRLNMSQIKNPPKETPALVKTIQTTTLKYQEIPDTIINSLNFKNPDENTKILHFKGTRIGDAEILLKNRLNNLKSII